MKKYLRYILVIALVFALSASQLLCVAHAETNTNVSTGVLWDLITLDVNASESGGGIEWNFLNGLWKMDFGD